MPSLTLDQEDALRSITGFEMKNGRGASIGDLAYGQFSGSEAAAEHVVRSLVIAGQLRRAPHSRDRTLQALAPIAVPRAPDGQPLHFVRIGDGA